MLGHGEGGSVPGGGRGVAVLVLGLGSDGDGPRGGAGVTQGLAPDTALRLQSATHHDQSRSAIITPVRRVGSNKIAKHPAGKIGAKREN